MELKPNLDKKTCLLPDSNWGLNSHGQTLVLTGGRREVFGRARLERNQNLRHCQGTGSNPELLLAHRNQIVQSPIDEHRGRLHGPRSLVT
jgi:hypothetical protein